ncbi:Zinc finger protein 891 [Acipenser ruthenus]|uniref:Zinc finger protein 891 n=1 Tax=Acipenser ruthenus TaxID=7906 RepID=A0A444V117_ACIRT|nr:Zinc finger protein 891 [Acipenser ruthenus]
MEPDQIAEDVSERGSAQRVEKCAELGSNHSTEDSDKGAKDTAEHNEQKSNDQQAVRFKEEVIDQELEPAKIKETKNTNKKASKESPSSDTLYICTECGKSFNQLQTLKRHIRTHAAHTSYQCSECDQSFSQLTSVEESEEVSDHYPEPVHIKEEVIDPELEPGRIAQDVSELGAIRVVEDTTELQSPSEIHCKRKMPEAQRLTCKNWYWR